MRCVSFCRWHFAREELRRKITETRLSVAILSRKIAWSRKFPIRFVRSRSLCVFSIYMFGTNAYVKRVSCKMLN